MIPEESFLADQFRKYYRRKEIIMPDRIQSREIGFIPFTGTMVRHYSFQDARYASAFVRKIVPRHLYYSTAYYRKPEERVMQDKMWLGAELIFDLDADHLKNAERMAYHEILEEVKKHTVRLVNDYLLGDLGFQKEKLHVYFSGGRGYHVHVHGEDVYAMTSDMRREVANYCRMEGFGHQEYLKTLGRKQKNGTGITVRFSQYFSDFVKRLESGGEEEEAIALGILGEKAMKTLQKNMDALVKAGSKFRKRSELLAEMWGSRHINLSAEENELLKGLINIFIEKNACEIDEPVTTDVHRLIRFPGSLHGKTGLEVVPVQIDELGGFDPLKSAIPDVFMEGEEEVIAPQRIEISMAGKEFVLESGLNKVPTYLAIFLVAQKKCKLK